MSKQTHFIIQSRRSYIVVALSKQPGSPQKSTMLDDDLTWERILSLMKYFSWLSLNFSSSLPKGLPLETMRSHYEKNQPTRYYSYFLIQCVPVKVHTILYLRLSQNMPCQPSSQMHSSGCSQYPFKQPGSGRHLSQSGPVLKKGKMQLTYSIIRAHYES